MKVVIQRSLKSSVLVHGNTVGEIDKGFVLLVGFTYGDNESDLDYMVKKVTSLRIFEDENNKLNLSLIDIGGSILSISQFTLYADTKKGNRPSFIKSLSFDEANELYRLFNEKLKETGIHVEQGIFGSQMKVQITNNGPVTIILESRETHD